jgi:hypothetical protein
VRPEPARGSQTGSKLLSFNLISTQIGYSVIYVRGFRQSLYECLKARADALFELTDAVLCADHPVTSLVQLCLEPEFTRGHGAL